MESVRLVLSVLLVLLKPTSCSALAISDPMICYILDGVLIVYCIIATTLFFREKFSHQVATVKSQQQTGGIYQELGQAKNADQYEELQTFKKKPKKRKKSQVEQPAKEQGPEPLPGTSSAP
ncbi:hypothetical protein WMY93_028625 [Mugilogobius chulae]|uniref:T-cell surface glycoprotein CD3 zeta chain n=1 Tax=Mugilogobius chulae TaxID=88201 RepID=A0AAW0MV26_9GOBI